MSTFSPAELKRYSRHFLLPEVGMEGQARLKGSSVLIIGLGGLGSPVSLYLAAAGVGRIGLIDFDIVDESNLHRQLLYSERDVGLPKLEVAAERLREVNPHVNLEVHQERLDRFNAERIISNYDVAADGTDNFDTRYLVNDVCVLREVPYVYASINRFEGQASVFCTSDGPCYRCLFPEPPSANLVPSCADAGVLGVLPGLLGTIQATEVIKRILGIGGGLEGRLLLVDALSMQFRSLGVSRDPNCPVCGESPSITLIDTPNISCEQRSEPQPMNGIPEISVQEYLALRDSDNPPFLLDVRQPGEFTAANLGGTLIPLAVLPLRTEELRSHRRDKLVVVLCQMGGRSAQAVRYLRMNGFENVVNLRGGIQAWVQEIGQVLVQD